MKHAMHIPIGFAAVIAAVAAAGLTGCLSDSGSPPAQAPSTPGNQNTLEGIYGNLIYAKELGGEHKVEFYDFGGGNLGIREMGSLDESAKPILPGSQIQSLEAAYLKLNPNASSVPEAIRAADQAAPGENRRVMQPGLLQRWMGGHLVQEQLLHRRPLPLVPGEYGRGQFGMV